MLAAKQNISQLQYTACDSPVVDDSSRLSGATVIDLFCGAGGLSLGFKQRRFHLAAGIDIDENCRYPYKRNIRAAFIHKDVALLSPKELRRLYPEGGARVLVGCAPCQPFSAYTSKGKDAKWKLLEVFKKIAVEVRPDVISMENVPRLVSFENGKVFQGFCSMLDKIGYCVDWGVLHGPDFGVAQTRSRLVLLASTMGAITLPRPTHGGRHSTVRDVIGDLPPIRGGEVSSLHPLHRASRLNRLNELRIKASVPGGSWQDWPKKLRAHCHRKETGQTYRNVYGRMRWDEPSPTITTQFRGYGNGRFGHPEQDRALSLLEGALLQGFPIGFEFVEPGEPVNAGNVSRLIGNAVPVPLANAIAGAVEKHIAGLN